MARSLRWTFSPDHRSLIAVDDPVSGRTVAREWADRADGTPDFGIPVGNGPLPDRLSPLDRKHQFVRVEGERVVVGEGPVATTQFRMVPSRADANKVALVPVESPASKLVVGGDSVLTVAPLVGALVVALVPRRQGELAKWLALVGFYALLWSLTLFLLLVFKQYVPPGQTLGMGPVVSAYLALFAIGGGGHLLPQQLGKAEVDDMRLAGQVDHVKRMLAKLIGAIQRI